MEFRDEGSAFGVQVSAPPEDGCFPSLALGCRVWGVGFGV